MMAKVASMAGSPAEEGGAGERTASRRPARMSRPVGTPARARLPPADGHPRDRDADAIARARSETALERSAPLLARYSRRELPHPPARASARLLTSSHPVQNPAQLRSINNRLPWTNSRPPSADVGDGARGRRRPHEDAPARPADPERRATRNAARPPRFPPPPAARPRSRVPLVRSPPLPQKYELLADVFIVLQQVGPLRKRQQCTATSCARDDDPQEMHRRRAPFHRDHQTRDGVVQRPRGRAGIRERARRPHIPACVRADVAVPAGTAQEPRG